MNMKKNLYVGFRRCAAFTVGAVICASLFVPARMSAQNPGLGGAKTSPAIPIALEDVVSKRVTEYVVAEDEVQRHVLLTGELKAARSSIIQAPRIQNNFGNMITYMVEEGTIVTPGQRIVEFDDSSLVNNRTDVETQVETAKLQVQRTINSLESQRLDLLNSVVQAEANLEVAGLNARIDKSLLSENQYQQYQLSYMKTQLNLEKAKENLDNFEKNFPGDMAQVEIALSQREIELRRIDNDIKLLKINAVQGGIFLYGDNWQSNRKVQVGDSIFPGMEVASIPDLGSLQVVGYVFDTEYRLLSAGMRAQVCFDALPDVSVEGNIVSLTSVASRRGFASDKKLFQAVIQLDDVGSDLFKPGMTARVNVPLVLAKGVPVVPREYVGVDSLGRNFVHKGADIKKLETQVVEVGAIGDTLFEISSGVSIGEKLFPVQ